MSRIMAGVGLFLAAGLLHANAQPQSPDEAWWTGPLLANSAAALPQGHAMVEAYLLDIATGHANMPASLTYLLYGVTDRLTVGPVPFAGYQSVRGGADSSGVKPGDLGLFAKYAFVKAEPAHFVPDLSLALQENVPTGKYDNLNRAADGFGSGTYSTIVSLYSQLYLWAPDDHLMRARLDLSAGFSGSAAVNGMSVYGTSAGFAGRARPGNTLAADAAIEYSLTKQWVLALDVIANHGNQTFVDGAMASGALHRNLGTSDDWGFAPAIEYNVTGNLGVIVGARFILPGHNNTPSVTPGLAINYVD